MMTDRPADRDERSSNKRNGAKTERSGGCGGIFWWFKQQFFFEDSVLAYDKMEGVYRSSAQIAQMHATRVFFISVVMP